MLDAKNTHNREKRGIIRPTAKSRLTSRVAFGPARSSAMGFKPIAEKEKAIRYTLASGWKG